MPRLLIVKTSSLGDVIHCLPVVSDLMAAQPGWEVDWVCEAPYAVLTNLCAGVARTHPVNLRAWKRAPFGAEGWRAYRDAKTALGAARYDLILDLQGLVKSAWIASWARGPRAGLDWTSAREPLASLTYQRRFGVRKDAHAVWRNRALAALALGYQQAGLPDYGLAALRAGAVPAAAPDRYAVLLFATSRVSKTWPTREWLALSRWLRARGLEVVLPWGSEAERQAAHTLASAIGTGAHVAPSLGLDEVAQLLARAECVVGVDTGLAHLAVALGTTTIGVYTATNPARTGLHGGPAAINLGGVGQCPTSAEVQAVLAPFLAA